MAIFPPAQVFANGIIIGSIYAMIAIGFSLSYNQLGFINFLHGGLYLISSYIAFLLFSKLGIGLFFSGAICIIIVVLLNIILTKVLFLRYQKYKTNSSILMIVSFILLLLIQNIIILFFNSDAKVIKSEAFSSSFSLGSIVLTYQNLLISTSVFILLIGFYLFLHKSKIGLEIRAVSHNTTSAELKGIDSKKIISVTAGLSAFFATIAGIFITLEQNIEPQMGFIMVFKGITASIIGGNKVYGAVLGALIIGIMENLSVWYFPTGYKNLVTFILMILFIFIFPEGMFNSKMREDS